ncbi:DinB family protein [Geothrix sp. PMB-07]|uniref:DinB family protein n=1 Tax=Geothrix sp. PMB-07 TaxID=3068640 RepID=UPI0027420F8D|nr:DinB family protein [Geothrix sp. PMB-07]WLT31099.1 DinB family protein [Geothrix sp. PMB-07]
MPIAQTLLPEFTHEMAGLRRVIERLPEDHLAFRPHAKSFTLGDLANHLVTVPGWTVSTMTATELDFGLPEVRARQPKPSSTVEGLLRTLDKGVEEALEALSKAPDEAFSVVWTLKNEGQVILAMPRIAVYRGFVMNHLIHHRAQLAVYLRLLDRPVPALYGPSADEN